MRSPYAYLRLAAHAEQRGNSQAANAYRAQAATAMRTPSKPRPVRQTYAQAMRLHRRAGFMH